MYGPAPMSALSSSEMPTLPWWPAERGGSLGLEKIASAAIELIDEGGEANLTMRRLAERLDTAPMTIYWYVANRDELLAVVRDAALAPVLDALDDSHGWQATLRSMAQAMRTDLVDLRPRLVPLVASSGFAPGPNVLNMIERVLRALLEDGFSTVEATWAFQMVANVAIGLDAEVRAPGLEALVEQGIDGFPTITQVMRHYAETPEQIDRFQETLDAAIAGIAVTTGRTP